MKNESPTLALGPPVKRQGLQQTAYKRIRKGILTGKIAPGVQLKIGELAAALNVSANPVREALRQLEAEGMVCFCPNRRIEVIQLSHEDLEDIYFLLLPLEEMALKRCFKSIRPSHLKELKAYCEQMSDEEIIGSRWIELNWLFHKKIHEISGSPRLAIMLRNLRNNITPYLYISFEDEKRIRQANEEHSELISAFESEDYSSGEQVLRKHLINGQLAISSILNLEKKPLAESGDL